MTENPDDFEGMLLERRAFDMLDRLIFRSNAGTRRPARLRVTDGVLFIDGVAVPRDSYTTGYVLPVEDRESARLCLTGADHLTVVDVELASTDQAERMLASLGLRQDRLAVSFMGSWPLVGMAGLVAIIVAVAVAFGLRESWQLALLIGLPLLVFGLATLRASRFPVIIAPDGVTIQRLGMSRFIAYEDLEDVSKDSDSSVLFSLRDGSTVGVEMERDAGGGTSMLGAIGGGGTPLHEAVFKLVKKHLAAHRQGGSERLGERLARGGRPMDSWLADIHKLERGDYREESPSRAQLWRVLKDGTADASARAAAARLLRPKGDELKRLRIVIDNAASPPLRVALETVEEEDATAEQEAFECLT